MSAPVTGADGRDGSNDQLESYNLAKGKWQTSFGYRWFRSHRHFVGSVEQNAENVAKGGAERDRSGTEVINHVHVPTVGISYGVTNRLSLSADLPYFHAHRRSPYSGSRPTFVTRASGISDLNIMGRYWLGDPAKQHEQNLAFGLGFKAPTGNDRAADDFLVRVDRTTGARITDRRPVDQSIQPGDGGWGIIAELQAFKSFGRLTAFAAGNYLSNPREQNDFLRDPANLSPDPSSAYLSIADQYAARVGIATSVKKLGVSLGARLEGVPFPISSVATWAVVALATPSRSSPASPMRGRAVSCRSACHIWCAESARRTSRTSSRPRGQVNSRTATPPLPTMR